MVGLAMMGLSTVDSAGVAAIASPGHAADAQPPPDASWRADLAVDGDDTNVRNAEAGIVLSRTAGPPARAASTGSQRAQGMLLTEPHELAEPADRFSVDVVADRPAGSDVLIDVRGQQDDGSWSEWIPARPDAPGVLDAGARTVQGRVMLLAGDGGTTPTLRSLEFTADLAPGVRLRLESGKSSYRVFATREGLVGGTTANGHVIRERDHFAALPSRRGLAPRGTGDYTVKVCADNDRCEWAPVWDVGPWNTTDDHWNPSDLRESWRDLAQGLPQAQAAFEDGYNGGRDQFGRRVVNPAGIDLADGMFWDGLRLRDNSWVTVSYLWTGSGPIATVRSYLINVRNGPTSRNQAVGLAAQHAQLRVECVVAGQRVAGSQGTTNQWLRIGPNRLVSAAHVATPPGIRRC
ncbi:MAG: hypothetical protein GEU83_04555 [Pseudonocardiaceae bacterium]|nr:hypothetical protein [Pseudonocardiaceae bacterium]